MEFQCIYVRCIHDSKEREGDAFMSDDMWAWHKVGYCLDMSATSSPSHATEKNSKQRNSKDIYNKEDY